MNIDIRHLRYFRAVAEERSFTRAAERLHMAQPPLSRRIQELEAEIGALLFEREQRPLRLTAIGQLLYEQASMVTEAMERLQAVVHQATRRPRTRFTIGMVPSTLYVRFPQIVARFRERHPEIDLRLAEMDSAEQASALVDGRLDLGFDRIAIEDPLIRHDVMREEPLWVALPESDPLLAEGRAVALAELAPRPQLLYPKRPRPGYADHVLKAFRERDLTPQSITELRELQTALVMVAAGGGVCIVPDTVRLAGRPGVGFAPLVEDLRVPLLIRFRKHDRSPALRAFMEVYAELHREWGWPFPDALAGVL
ncbi:LysR family transcriptional regulator [Novosphingobium rosa]|uniref:LysR family transcriptional regulator n=1 Tax=Novosphingobium rosa TaxID=76978 RepID=UPI000A7136B9|nr:LysR family transcriptional regulator [Novosphingobium rosa]